MNILITSASRKVNLVRAFKEALKREGGGRVIAVDASPLSAALYAADSYHIVPRLDDAKFTCAIREICKKDSVDLIIPTRDEDLLYFARHKGSLEKEGIIALVSNPETIKICQDKRLFLKFCVKNKFRFPKTFTENRLPAPGDYPIFVKPARGKGGRGTFCAASPKELTPLLKSHEDLIIQRLIGAPEYSIDLFCDLKGKVISAVPRRRISLFGGESFVSRTCYDKTLISEGARMAKRIRLIGPATMQVFLYRGKTIFIEVNARFGGATNLSIAAGANSPLFIVQLLKGKKIKYRLDGFKDNLTMLRYTNDYFLNG